MRPFFLSSPTDVLAATRDLFQLQDFLQDVVASVLRIMAGFLVSAVIAIPVGILMGRLRAIDALLGPLTSFVRYLPVPALLPFCILWFGIGEFEKMMVVFIGVYFQLVLMIADIARNVPGELLDIAYTMGASRRGAILRVVVPYSLPQIMDSLRITLGWAWGWLILAELVGAAQGIGFVIIKSQRYLMNAHMIVGLLIVGLLGLLSDIALAALNKAMFRWRES